MKKFNKIIPLLMIVPLLGACNLNGSRVKSMSKPKLASYSNKVTEEEFYNKSRETGNESFKKLFARDGDTLKGLDKGITAKHQAYQEYSYSLTDKNGIKRTSTYKASGVESLKADASSYVINLASEEAAEIKMVNASFVSHETASVGDGYYFVVPQEDLEELSEQKGVSSEENNVSMYYLNNKRVSADNVLKEYTQDSEEVTDVEKQKLSIAIYIAMQISDIFEAALPTNAPAVGEFTRYQDNDVFTTILEKTNDNIDLTYEGKSYKVSNEIYYAYQIDFASLKLSTIQEVTVKTTHDGVTSSYAYKYYDVASVANTKTTVKAPDLSKYTNLD